MCHLIEKAFIAPICASSAEKLSCLSLTPGLLLEECIMQVISCVQIRTLLALEKTHLTWSLRLGTENIDSDEGKHVKAEELLYCVHQVQCFHSL